MAVLTTFLFLRSLYLSYYWQPNYSHRQLSYCNTLLSLFVSTFQCSKWVVVISFPHYKDTIKNVTNKAFRHFYSQNMLIR